MRRRTVACFGLAVALAAGTGCGDLLDPDTPSISEEVTVQLLADLYLLDTRQQLIGDLPQTARDSVFAMHRVTEAEYDETMRYYAHHPEEYLKVYNRVIDLLMAEEPAR